MTDLEQAVADALRLGKNAAEKLLSVIQRNIEIARLELIRAGVSEELAQSDHALVEDAVITFCLYKMDSDSMQEKHWSAFQYQEDNLRKSTIELTEDETEDETEEETTEETEDETNEE